MCNVLKFNDLYDTKLLIIYHKLLNDNTSSNFLNFKATISKANERYIIRSPKYILPSHGNNGHVINGGVNTICAYCIK